MKTVVMQFMFVLFFPALGAATLGGDLNPPAPPSAGGTMKTLEEVEPRIAIPASDTPVGTYTISQPGSYYLMGDRYCSADGIQVDADNVTIDLMGYSLIGTDSGSGNGINIGGQKNVEIRNGTILDFGQNGIYSGDITSSKNHRVLNVRAISNKGNGIFLLGEGNLIKDCTAAENAEGSARSYAYGIYAGTGSTVVNNTAGSNGRNSEGRAYGIYAYLSTVIGNTASNNGYESEDVVFGICATGGTVRGNSAYSNGTKATGSTVYGIYCGPGCAVVGNTAYRNGIDAVSAVYGIGLAGQSLVDQNSAYDNNGTNMSSPGSCTYGTNHAP